MSGEYGGWGRTFQLSASKVSLTTLATCGRALCWKITLSCVLSYWGRLNQMHSVSFLPWIFDLAVEVDAWPGLHHNFLRFGLSQWIAFGPPSLFDAKNPSDFAFGTVVRTSKNGARRLFAWIHAGPNILVFASYPWPCDGLELLVESLPRFQRTPHEFGMNLGPTMPPTPRLQTLLASLRVLYHWCRNHHSWNAGTNTHQYNTSYIFLKCIVGM